MAENEPIKIARHEKNAAVVTAIVASCALVATILFSLEQLRIARDTAQYARTQTDEALEVSRQALALAREQSVGQSRSEIARYIADMGVWIARARK